MSRSPGLDALLAGRGAVARVLGAPEQVAAGLVGVGWSVLEVRATTVADFHDQLARALGRHRYGANLDALWDVLADLDQQTALLWTGWDELAHTAPEQLDRLLRVLGERADQGPVPFAVALG